jgi:hypothetical protein
VANGLNLSKERLDRPRQQDNQLPGEFAAPFAKAWGFSPLVVERIAMEAA